MKNKFFILEGPDGVGKTTFQNILLSYFNYVNPENRIISDREVKNEILSGFISELRKKSYLVSLHALQHVNISIQIDNFYKYVLPAFKSGYTAIFDRSWLSTYVYSLFYGIPQSEAKAIVSPIVKIWLLYKKQMPAPVFILLRRDNTLKTNELNQISFNKLTHLYEFAKNQKIFKAYNFVFVDNNSNLETTWMHLSNALNISYIPLHDFYNT